MYPMTTTLAATMGLSASAAYFSPMFWRRSRMSHLHRAVVNSRLLALTYDDGPSSTLTPLLLDLLRRWNAHATFFMLGQHAERHRSIVERISEEGHDIGCHSDKHVNAWTATPWKAIADINAGYARLSTWVKSDGIFRPPNGKMTLPTYWSIGRRGASVWWWTIDSGDSHPELPRAQQITDLVSKANGGIVLMHDGSISIRAQERNDFVLELTQSLLDLARRQSLRVVPIREIAA